MITVIIFSLLLCIILLYSGIKSLDDYYNNSNFSIGFSFFIAGALLVSNLFFAFTNTYEKSVYVKAIHNNPYKECITVTYDANDSTIVKTDTTYILK